MSVFGRMLRGQRVKAGLSLRDVADKVGISHVYLGEVERGQRGPLPEKHWAAVCAAIPGLMEKELRESALASKPIELNVGNAPPRYRNLALALQRRINDQSLKDDDLDQLYELLGVDDE